MKSSSKTAVICSYFNPLGWKSRLVNFENFRDRLFPTLGDAHFISIECVRERQPFEVHSLSPRHEVLRVTSPDVLWQKERLFNLAIQSLRERGFEKVIWLDGDIWMGDPGWLAKAEFELDRVKLCQVFSHSLRSLNAQVKVHERPGVAYQYLKNGTIRLRGLSSGYAWGARLEIFDSVSLFDKAILGGGDAAIWLGSLFGVNSRKWWLAVRRTHFYQSLGPSLRAHYLEWAEAFGATVKGNVGFVDQRIGSFFHGQIKNRRYGVRYRFIPSFDPEKDLCSTSSGAWAFSAESLLRPAVFNYFESRREDG